MASSKIPYKSSINLDSAPLDIALSQALSRALTKHLPVLKQENAIAVAFSGGLDSSVLLHSAAQWATQHDCRLFAFHIHHGLSSNADQWETFCAAQAHLRQIPFYAAHVQIDLAHKGLEAAAREARYAELERLCKKHAIAALLTAHHADDQNETLLFRYLRGTGLSGMEGIRTARSLNAGNSATALLRPFLEIPRARIAAYAQTHQLKWINDESNQNTRFKRNALRHDIVPKIQEHFPDYALSLRRLSRHIIEANQLLDELATLDLKAIQSAENTLDLKSLQSLNLQRQANLLRYWLRQMGCSSPPEAHLHNLVQQLKGTPKKKGSTSTTGAMTTAHSDTQLHWQHQSHSLRVYQQQIYFEKSKCDRFISTHVETVFYWTRQTQFWPLPQEQGHIFFKPTQTRGIPESLLSTEALFLRQRSGGETLKLHSQRPTKTLKAWFQEKNIPPWKRHFPLIFLGETLLYVPQLGHDERLLKNAEETPEPLWQLVWQPPEDNA